MCLVVVESRCHPKHLGMDFFDCSETELFLEALCKFCVNLLGAKLTYHKKEAIQFYTWYHHSHEHCGIVRSL